MPLPVDALVAYLFPFGKGPRGYVGLVTGSDALRASILQIIGTAPGERVTRPTFGCDVHRRVFSPNDPTAQAVIAHDIQEALRRWQPAIQVLEVTTETDETDERRLLVSVRYQERSTGVVASLDGELPITP